MLTVCSPGFIPYLVSGLMTMCVPASPPPMISNSYIECVKAGADRSTTSFPTTVEACTKAEQELARIRAQEDRAYKEQEQPK